MGMSLGLGRPSKVMGLFCVCFCYSSFFPLSVWYSAPINKRIVDSSIVPLFMRNKAGVVLSDEGF